MGLFDKLISKPETDEDIALQLFESQGIGSVVGKNAKKILNSCKDKQAVLLKAIDLCGENPKTPKQLYVVSNCYVCLGAKYRLQAIEYLEKYIDVGAVWSGTPKDTIKFDGYSVNQLEENKALVYYNLGKAYEGEYEFEKAEQAYSNAEKIEPHFATYSICVANTYIKRNNLQKALDYLENKKYGNYYKKNINDYKILLDSAIDDVMKKIEKGYQYKPRKKQNK